MTDYEEGTKECLSGHTALYSEFGTDVSRTDALNPYCRSCVREQREKQRMEKTALGLPMSAPMPKKEAVPTNVLSERAVERERHKRRVEKEIELSLRYSRDEPKERSSASVFSKFGWYRRQPKAVGHHWGTW